MAAYKVKINKSKQEAVNHIKDFIKGSKDIVFTNYCGLSVSQITDIRRKLKENNCELKVIKNNLTRIAFKEMNLKDVSEFLVGMTALAVTEIDAGPMAKVIYDFTTDTSVKVKGAIIGNRIFSSEEVKALSELPGKQQLIVMLMCAMIAPLKNFIYTAGGVTQKLARVLQAVADKKGAE